jgi:hypothetical protein
MIRKNLGADITIGVLYANPTLRTLSAQVDRLRSGQAATVDKTADTVYSKSLDELINTLDTKYNSADPEALSPSTGATFFLTGATGFLGAYLVKDIMERKNTKLIAHIRGAKDLSFAKERLVKSLKGYALWQDAWTDRISCVLGDLSKPRLGLDDASWKHVADTADVFVHNAAYVHWIARYEQMMRSNVLSTIDAMKLCNEGKPKLFSFVSSTSVLDTDHYVNLSDEQTATGRSAVLEADDMEGSRVGLGNGYGQTKWVCFPRTLSFCDISLLTSPRWPSSSSARPESAACVVPSSARATSSAAATAACPTRTTSSSGSARAACSSARGRTSSTPSTPCPWTTCPASSSLRPLTPCRASTWCTSRRTRGCA